METMKEKEIQWLNDLKVFNTDVIKNKDEALFKVKRDWIYFMACSEELQNDRDILLLAVSYNPIVLSLITDTHLVSDKEIAMFAINIDPIMAYNYLSEDIKKDEEVNNFYYKKLSNQLLEINYLNFLSKVS